MAILMSNWSTDDSLEWLQEGSCSGWCQQGNLAITNMKFFTSGAVESPSWQPEEFAWGSTLCNTADQTLGDCGPNCTECVWSWPIDESWDSDRADCRCKNPLDTAEAYVAPSITPSTETALGSEGELCGGGSLHGGVFLPYPDCGEGLVCMDTEFAPPASTCQYPAHLYGLGEPCGLTNEWTGEPVMDC